MPVDLLHHPAQPPAAAATAADAEEAQLLGRNSRSPQPYLRHGPDVRQNSQWDGEVGFEGRRGAGSRREEDDDDEEEDEDDEDDDGDHDDAEVDIARRQNGAARRLTEARSQAVSVTGSESGTEADDERVRFMRALPAPEVRPRKGLKVGERLEALLTPSQLDDEGRGYFAPEGGEQGRAKRVEGEEGEDEREKIFRRRVGEFARRSSEVALVGVMVLCVLCGEGVWQAAWRWRWELLSHVLVAAVLVVVYPIKLSIVDTCATFSRPWQRFRVPASFDPATVLYPPVLPVLVALTVSPLDDRLILPNLILGLASLPQRLFPRSSRLAGVNVLHWLISILPLIVAEYGLELPGFLGEKPASAEVRGGLARQVLVTLYPLHHALLQPLHYLTTTSLLITELHLLSVTLINLLLFASTPQTLIIKACLWIGGLSLFIATERVLHWNVTLARVPRWKFRRSGHTAQERRSLFDAVSELIKVQRATSAFGSRTQASLSDADEGLPATTLKQAPSHRLNLITRGLYDFAGESKQKPEPQSAVEPRKLKVNGSYSNLKASSTRLRRNTLPVNMGSSTPPRPLSTRRRGRPGNLLWCLQLTPAQAQQRKWLYAGYVYVAIAIIVFGPVRSYVSTKALNDQEPIGWALSYLFGQIPLFRDIVLSAGLQAWIPLPHPAQNLTRISVALPLSIPTLRSALGPANTRLLLIAYWALILLLGLLAVTTLTATVEVDTRRKVFHGVMVAMLLPATFIDPCACALALALILALFLLLEVLRAGQVPPLGNAIGRFVAPYVDGRDLRGPVVVSHIFLLVGCAVPLWLSLASTLRLAAAAAADAADPWDLPPRQRDLGMVAGVVCVGMGDAAASLIGRRYGRHKWVWVGGKSLEGSAAFAAAVTAGLIAAKAWLLLGGWRDGASPAAADAALSNSALFLLKAGFCACAASFLEAVLTGANDNVAVPVALWLFVKGVRL